VILALALLFINISANSLAQTGPKATPKAGFPLSLAWFAYFVFAGSITRLMKYRRKSKESTNTQRHER
jgi:hypothetical protein